MAGEILCFKKKWIWVDLKKEKKSFYYFRCRLAWSKNGELLYKCWFCPFQEKSSLLRSDWSIEWSLPSDTGVWGVDLPGIVECSDVSWVPTLLHYQYPALGWIVHPHIHAKVLILATSHVTLFKNRLFYVQLVKTDLVVRVGFETRLVAQSSA